MGVEKCPADLENLASARRESSNLEVEAPTPPGELRRQLKNRHVAMISM